MFKKMIEMYRDGKILDQESIGDKMILVNKNGFDLIIPKSNKDECGYFLINSIFGHDCVSYNSLSTHTYTVIEGNGIFIINGEKKQVSAGDTIVIGPNKEFYYEGKMLMVLKMEPNFKEEYNHVIKEIDYNNKGGKKK